MRVLRGFLCQCVFVSAYLVSTLQVEVAGTVHQSCPGYPVTGYTVVAPSRIHLVGQNRTLPAGFHTDRHQVALQREGIRFAVQSRIRPVALSRIRQVVRPAGYQTGFHRPGIRRQVVHRRVG